MLAPSPSHSRAGITPRRLILAASASVICAPVVVRAASLMPVRAVGPIGPQYYGWVERVFIHRSPRRRGRAALAGFRCRTLSRS